MKPIAQSQTAVLTARSEDAQEVLPTIDDGDLRNQLAVAEYVGDIYKSYQKIEVNELICISGYQYTSKMIVVMDHTILNRLEFNLTVPTPCVFLVRFLKATGPDRVIENLAFYLVELCLLHYKIIKYSPSILATAAATAYTVQCTLKKDPCWSKTLSLHTGYSKEDLKECANFMVDFHLSAGRNELRYVHEKYSDPCHGYVAFLCLANLPNDDSCTTSNDTIICISDNIDSSAQEGELERPRQLKARKRTAPSLTAMLTSQSEDTFRDSHQVLPSIDDGNIENQLAVVEYVEDIYKFYRTIEDVSCVPPD